MINSKDLYSYSEVASIMPNNINRIGTSIVTCEIRRYDNLRNQSSALYYQVLCTQRIIIPNQSTYISPCYTPGAQPPAASGVGFWNYPAICANSISLNAASGASMELVSYAPKTINSAVSTSVSAVNSDNSSNSYQHTSGSSTSQSNSFGASASLGFFGDMLTGGLSINDETTTGNEKSSSIATGSENSNSRQRANGDAMTVKDWGCSAFLDVANLQPTWIWGQEYPWNVVLFCNTLDNNSNVIDLPTQVSNLLYDGSNVLPPSQLSLFGIDFTMKALWVIAANSVQNGNITLTHTLQYCMASHGIPAGSTSFQATVQSVETGVITTPSQFNINLYQYGLDPIVNTAPNHVAIIGFAPNKFIVTPLPAQVNNSAITPPTAFTIIAPTNTLLIQDTTPYSGLTVQDDANAGFSVLGTTINATFTQNCHSLCITLNFKIVDVDESYSLIMKHWKTNIIGVQLTFTFNGDTGNQVVKNVDSLVEGGGENNLLTIALRNLNYGTAEFHDFLQLGLNTIQITINPLGANFGNCGYQIRAISIEKN